MRAIPRALAAFGVASALTIGAVPGGTQTETVVVPRAEAQATTLRVSLFGQQLIVSEADTAASSAPSAQAQGTGALLATMGFGQSTATADSATPTSGGETPTCGDVAVPAEVPLPVTVTAACSASQASAAEGAGTAAAQSDALTIAVSAASLPDDLTEATDQILDPLLELLGQAPLPDQLDLLQLAVQAALDGAVNVVTVEAGSSEASSTASGAAASGTASSEGVVVKILDGLVATITVGRSVATATFEGGELSAEHATAPVSVELGAQVLGALGLPAAPPIPVPPGQVIDLPLPAPLTSKITVAGGEDEIGDTTARSSAANIRLDLATGLPGGGVVVAVADAAAAVERPAEEPPPPANPPADPPDVAPNTAARAALPRTGGEGSWVPVGVLLGVGASITVLVLRRTRPHQA